MTKVNDNILCKQSQNLKFTYLYNRSGSNDMFNSSIKKNGPGSLYNAAATLNLIPNSLETAFSASSNSP